MTPRIEGFDHIHLYVGDRTEAERWYERVRGFSRVEALMQWADETGPLTLENPAGTVHLALFERADHPPGTAVAFSATAEQFVAWKEHLQAHGLQLRIADHELAWSLYFRDPWQNLREITSLGYAEAAALMGGDTVVAQSGSKTAGRNSAFTRARPDLAATVLLFRPLKVQAGPLGLLLRNNRTADDFPTAVSLQAGRPVCRQHLVADGHFGGVLACLATGSRRCRTHGRLHFDVTIGAVAGRRRVGVIARAEIERQGQRQAKRIVTATPGVSKTQAGPGWPPVSGAIAVTAPVKRRIEAATNISMPVVVAVMVRRSMPAVSVGVYRRRYAKYGQQANNNQNGAARSFHIQAPRIVPRRAIPLLYRDPKTRAERTACSLSILHLF